MALNLACHAQGAAVSALLWLLAAVFVEYFLLQLAYSICQNG